MADDSSDQEKTEAATPRRVEKAREDGQVARSRELTTFLLLLGGLGGLWGMGGMLYDQLGTVMEQAFLFERQHAFDSAAMLAHFWVLGERTLFALLPLFVLMTVLALAAPSLLGGLLISAKSLQPQLSKLNPLKDSLFIEDASSPYANLLVAREDNANSPAMKKLAAALNSPEVKQFLADKYQGAVVPAF